MAKPKIINRFGVLTGWSAITVNLFGRELEGFDEVDYSDETKLDSVYGAGNYPIGVAEGNYEAKASINILLEENISLLASLPRGTRVQDIPFFDVVVAYEHNGLQYKDILRNCRFLGNGRSAKNGEGKMMYKYDLWLSHIDFDA